MYVNLVSDVALTSDADASRVDERAIGLVAEKILLAEPVDVEVSAAYLPLRSKTHGATIACIAHELRTVPTERQVLQAIVNGTGLLTFILISC